MNLHGFRGFESHPHRQKTKHLADSEQVLGSNSFRANAVQMANGLIGNPCGRERGRAGRAQFSTLQYGSDEFRHTRIVQVFMRRQLLLSTWID